MMVLVHVNSVAYFSLHGKRVVKASLDNAGCATSCKIGTDPTLVS